MRFAGPPDTIPHRERNNFRGRAGERRLHLILLGNAGEFGKCQMAELFIIVNTYSANELLSWVESNA
jgi:hypothetical protein